MKKYLVNYKDDGVVFECFATQVQFDEMRNNGSLVGFRELTHGEIMEIKEYGF